MTKFNQRSFSTYGNNKHIDGHCIRFVRTCKNYPYLCNKCVRIQGKYTEYKEKVNGKKSK